MCERRLRSCFSEREANEKKAAPCFFFFLIERAVLFVQLNSASIRSDGGFEMHLFIFSTEKKKRKRRPCCLSFCMLAGHRGEEEGGG